MVDQNIWYAVILVVGSLIGALLGYLGPMKPVAKRNEFIEQKERKKFECFCMVKTEGNSHIRPLLDTDTFT